jgi:hypothetical protein
VTNNTINIEQNILGVIKEPSEKLFAFKSTVIGIDIKALQPDALFLFSSLAKLTLLAAERRFSTYLGKTILRKVTIFETVSTLKSELFVKLKFRQARERNCYPERKQGKRRVTLGDKIGMARERLDSFNMNRIQRQPIDDLFTFIDEEKRCFTDELVCWPRLVKLNMRGCSTNTLKNPKLFEKLVPNLRKLNLCQNYIKSLDADVFKYADKLLELGISFSKNDNHIKLTNDSFYSLENLRVLNIDLDFFDSLEPFSCLCNLEELIINVSESPIKRLDAFPSQLSKLRVLKLNLCKVELVLPTVFDNLKCLERLEFDCFSNSGIQQLEIGVAPRFLKVLGVKTLRLRSCESSVGNFETIELSKFNPPYSNMYFGEPFTKLECDWPLSGLKKLSASLLDEKSLSLNQMLNLEFLSLDLPDFGLLSRSGFGCLCKLAELQVNYKSL